MARAAARLYTITHARERSEEQHSMAEERKSRREVLYDHKKEGRREEEKPAERRGRTMADREPGERVEHATERDDGKGGDHAALFKRHENERRDMHGQHRTEHRALEAEGGSDLHHKKMALHRHHERARADLHDKHEKELMTAMMSQGGGGGGEAPAEGEREAA